MGYYTKYELETSEQFDEIQEAIVKESNYSSPFEESCKWYDHEEDIKAVSERFPNVLITLSGEGEEQPDLWKKYFKNGKMQRADAIVTYPEFDENLLE